VYVFAAPFVKGKSYWIVFFNWFCHVKESMTSFYNNSYIFLTDFILLCYRPVTQTFKH
jgi:hypothetical protein